jgi:hypothetical protein
VPNACKTGPKTFISCPLAALLVGEMCSRTKSTLRYFSSARLASEQDLKVLEPVYWLEKATFLKK